jgi:putative hydrolase of the HAD superfamily
MGVEKIETVMFDFVDTLAYEVKEDYVNYYSVLKELGYTTEQLEFKKGYDTARKWLQREREGGRIWTEETRSDFIRRILKNLKLQASDGVISRVIDIFPYKVEFKAFKDAEPTLSQLRQKKFKLVICSNISSERNLRIYLKSSNLEKYFDALVASGTVGYEKPDPKIFEIASRLSMTKPERIIHIGDLYEYDYVGAESAGMRALLIDRKGRYKDKKITRIPQLDEVFDYL